MPAGRSYAASPRRDLSLLIDHPQRPREQPRQPLAQAVAPVLPVVTVARLDEAHVHAGALQQRHQRAVLVDERLVDATGDEDAVDRPPGRGAEAVHELDDRCEQRTALALADV